MQQKLDSDDFLEFSRGKCPNCKKSLALSSITEEEFEIMLENFERLVVFGNGIYRITTPQEWDSYIQFIEKNGPFNIVVDGLNFSFATSLSLTDHKDGTSDKIVSNRLKKSINGCHILRSLFICSLSMPCSISKKKEEKFYLSGDSIWKIGNG